MRQSKRQQRSKRADLDYHTIPVKANRILHLILIAMCLIIVRVWHLSVIQYDQRLEESKKPQRKVVIESATRATIRDRFNLPLAINKISYQATILYSALKEIPPIAWETDETGKRVKRFKRREYIKKLSQLLGQELDLDAERIEDLIHAKASYYAQVPFVIKDEISESEYYKLKMLQRDWPGIHMASFPKRHYPRGRTAADIVGYMGAINRQEYEKILHEMKALEEYITQVERGVEAELPYGIDNLASAQKRLRDLEEKAYTIHDYVGKTGIEGVYEQPLRGFYGRRSYFSDSKGNFLWELPGSRASLPGHRVLLSISAELQEYAEQLLAQNEEFRIVRKSSLGLVKKTVQALKSPWIKGGAIVVMDPNNGELLTLASFPRFDPNDFISSGNSEEQQKKKKRINRWFENETYIAQMWNLQQPFEREKYLVEAEHFQDEQRLLTWPVYLDLVLPQNSDLRNQIGKITTIQQALNLLRGISQLNSLYPDQSLYTILNALYPNDQLEIKLGKKIAKLELDERALRIKNQLDPYFFTLDKNYDKVLLVDLVKLVIDDERFDEALGAEVGQFSLVEYRNATGAFVSIYEVVKELTRTYFHDQHFKSWRKCNEKEFLKQKRIEEKENRVYAKPYIDYLDKQEALLFDQFWNQQDWQLLKTFLIDPENSSDYDSNEERLPYLQYLRDWRIELSSGAHQAMPWKPHYTVLSQFLEKVNPNLVIPFLQTMRPYQALNKPLYGSYRCLKRYQNPLEKHLAGAFYPVYGYGLGRSHAYRQSTIQGSLFKIVTAYEALKQRYGKFEGQKITLEDLNPLVMCDQEFTKGNTRYLGYTEEGKPIPQLYKGGRLPRSLAHRNSGRVDLVRAMEVSSNPYFSILAGDHLENPEDLAKASRDFGFGEKTGLNLPGEISGKIPNDLKTNRTGLYAMAIGQHSLVVTPLQTAVMLSAIANGGKVLKPKIVNLTAGKDPIRTHEKTVYQSFVNKVKTEVKNELFMPKLIHKILLNGLHASVKRTYDENLSSLTKLYQHHPEAVMQFTSLKEQLLGKTSTSESVEHIDLDLDDGTNIYTHVWFGCISYDNGTTFLFKNELGQPELVVVVYLRYGGFGKEAAPLAAQMVKKWRELKQRYSAKR